MDPIRNPYAPGAGQRPPELAGRDEQLAAFDVVLERVARGRAERSLVLTGLLFITGQMSAIAFWLLETFPVFSQIG